MINWAMSWVAHHPDMIKGMLIGAAASHIKLLVRGGFWLLMKIPGAKGVVDKYEDQIVAGIDEGAAEFKQDVREQAAADKVSPPPPAQ